MRDAIEITAYGEHRAKVNKERQESRNVAIDPADEPQAAYLDKPRGNDEDELMGLRNTTRLGPDSITLIPVEVVEGGWRVGDMTFAPDHPIDDAIARRLYGRQMRLSRKAVVGHFSGRESPVAFAEHPLLRNFRPLPLVQGRYDQSGIRLRLDAGLGLIYGVSEDSFVPADVGRP